MVAKEFFTKVWVALKKAWSVVVKVSETIGNVSIKVADWIAVASVKVYNAVKWFVLKVIWFVKEVIRFIKYVAAFR